jgi:hypothetical protein
MHETKPAEGLVGRRFQSAPNCSMKKLAIDWEKRRTHSHTVGFLVELVVETEK